MAARQDQTLVIVNIACIVLMLAFAVATYFGFKGKSDKNQQLVSTAKQLSDEQARTRTLTDEAGQLREDMGFKREDNAADIKTAFETDMKMYSPGQAVGTSYRGALSDLFKQAKATEASEAEAKRQKAELDALYKVLETEKNAQIAATEKARADAQAAAAAERNQFVTDRANMDQKNLQLMSTLETQSNQFKAQITELQTKEKDYLTQITKQQSTIEELLRKLKPPIGSYDLADGRISWVNQGGVVWLNLGSANALRPLVTFSVFDADVQDASKATPKGTIEVTMIMGEHQAEARVTSDDPKNPILRDDGVYSPAWHRGKQLRFALTGIIDADGDGQSDLQLVRNLIGLNDGVVDSYLGDDGVVDGAMSVNTRYLVVGKVPEGTFRTKQLDGWLAMNKEAMALGIETITLDQFLDQMGYRPDARAVRLGAGGTARDFPAVPPRELSNSGISTAPPQFRTRRPPVETPTPLSPATPGSTSR